MSLALPQPARASRARRLLRPAALLLVTLVAATTVFTASAAPAKADFPFDVTVSPVGAVAANTPVTYEYSCTPTDVGRQLTGAYAAIQGQGLAVETIGERRYRFTYAGPQTEQVLLSCFYETSGKATFESYVVLAPTAPSAPTILDATVSSQSVTLTWSASDGGNEQARYEAQYRTGDGDWAAAPFTEQRSVVFDGLQNGTTYEFRVRATNSVGASAYSPTVLATPTRAIPTTSLTFSSLDGGPIVTGDQIRATVTVSGSAGAPTGTTTVFGIGPSCQFLPVQADGTASCIVGTPPPGSYTIAYDYSGDDDYQEASGLGTVVVEAAPTATSLENETAGTIVVGDEVALRATVTTDSDFLPIGTVTFTAGDETLCTVSVDEDGEAVCTTTDLPAGSNDVVATYGGDGRLAPSASAAVRVEVRKVATVLTITADPAAGVLAGDTVVVTVEVTGSPIDPTGSVTFETAGSADADTAAALLCADVELDDDGTATCTVDVPAGTTIVGASYSGDEAYAAAEATTTIEAARRALEVDLDADVASDGTVTATATAADGATPASAAFRVDDVLVPGCDAAPFDEDGTTVCVITGIAPGSHEVTAVVEDDPIYVDAEASASVTIAAAPGPSNPAPSNPAPSNPVPSNPASGSSPSGSVGLPRTGAEAPLWLLGVALLLVGIGAAPVVARRVRRG